MPFRMLLKIGCVLRNVRSPYLMKYLAPERHSPFTIFTSSITTTSVCYDHIPFDPIIDILYEDLLKKAKKEQSKTTSKMLSKDPPLESTDLNGVPIVPIDINPWMDQEEFDNLMGNSSPMRRRLLGVEGTMSMQPKRDIIRTVDEVIGEKTEPENKQDDIKLEINEEFNKDKTQKKATDDENDDNVDAEQMIAEALGQRSKKSKDN